MKRHILQILICTGLFFSCNDDFFEQVPGDTLTIEETFKYRNTTESYLANVYSYIPDEYRQRFPGGSENAGVWTCGSSEAEYVWNFVATQIINNGSWTTSSDIVKAYWENYYKGINVASVFMENVHQCTELEDAKKTQYYAEARALRAIYYYHLFRIYGPVVILPEVLGPDDPFDKMTLERSSVDECVDYIVSELDAAIESLPFVHLERLGGKTELGRIDQAICHAVKTQVLLYAASPLFNGNPDYATLKNVDGKALFPQTADKTKWARAAAAAKYFIDTYVPDYFDLHKVYIDEQAGRINPYLSYRETVRGSDFNNKEMIFYRIGNALSNAMYEMTPYHYGAPDDGYKGSGGKAATQEIVDAYFMANGLPIEDPNSGYPDSDDPNEVGFSKSAYNDPESGTLFAPRGTFNQWVNREPRFYADITFSGQKWLNTTNGTIYTETYKSGNSGKERGQNDYSRTGYIARKAAPLGSWQVGGRSLILIRLAEIYLNYVEALNQSEPGHPDILKYLNLIRERAGIPTYGMETGQILPSSDPAAIDALIKKERTVELAFENHRYFDVRRWKIAEQTENGDLHGLDIDANPPNFYKKVVFETRAFSKRHYFFPIPQSEINRGDFLVQNTGWNIE